MNEYKIVYLVKVRGRDFGQSHDIEEFDIVESRTARGALNIGLDECKNYNKQQEEQYEGTIAIPSIKNVKDIWRL